MEGSLFERKAAKGLTMGECLFLGSHSRYLGVSAQPGTTLLSGNCFYFWKGRRQGEGAALWWHDWVPHSELGRALGLCWTLQGPIDSFLWKLELRSETRSVSGVFASGEM